MRQNWESFVWRPTLVLACLFVLAAAVLRGGPASNILVPAAAMTLAAVVVAASLRAYSHSPKSLYAFIGLSHFILAVATFIQLVAYVEGIAGYTANPNLYMRLMVGDRILAALCLFSVPLLSDKRGFGPAVRRILVVLLGSGLISTLIWFSPRGSAANGFTDASLRVDGLILVAVYVAGSIPALVRRHRVERGTLVAVFVVASCGVIYAGSQALGGVSVASQFFGHLMYILSYLLTYIFVLNHTIQAEHLAFREVLDESLRDKKYLMRQLFAERESTRQRIALQLHDDVGQSLTMLIGALNPERVPRQGIQRLLSECRSLAVEALDSVRRIARELRPTTLDDLGLVATLQTYVGDFLRIHGIEGTLKVLGPEDVRFSTEIETVVYRAIVEALTNIARHSGAKRFSIVLDTRHSQLVAQIEDDGCGFDVANVRRGLGLGLTGISGRVEMVDGAVNIESAPGKGTTIVIRIPIRSDADAANGSDS